MQEFKQKKGGKRIEVGDKDDDKDEHEVNEVIKLQVYQRVNKRKNVVDEEKSGVGGRDEDEVLEVLKDVVAIQVFEGVVVQVCVWQNNVKRMEASKDWTTNIEVFYASRIGKSVVGGEERDKGDGVCTVARGDQGRAERDDS
ncbi:hypothetical protein NLI96_g1325 [Meripilus lineatus]|uniref:Uncharacterized protein n=1 Tax=Meripilus lineatus TaxID=2056292 RepID=A0AAD5VAC6_9APHY|nr:hypothetical protein NLI96_g1325 [Physisporinus lineatus]